MNLKQLNKKQLEALIELAESPSDMTFLEGSIPPSHVLTRSLELANNAVDSIWAQPYFIEIEAQIIGCCGFKSAPSHGRVEIGYHVVPQAQGLGAATFAVKQLCHIAFAADLVETVFATIAANNAASLHVVQKNGFSYKKLITDEDGDQLECWEFDKDIFVTHEVGKPTR